MMEKLNELVGLAEKADSVANLMNNVNPHTILAIAEAFLALEQRAEKAEIEKAGVEERCRMMLDAKNHWADRARAAKAKLAELEKQEPFGIFEYLKDDDGDKTDFVVQSDGFSKDSFNLYARPAPAINLAELVPPEKDPTMIAYVHLDETTADKPEAYAKGFNACRAAILRNIEEQSK